MAKKKDGIRKSGKEAERPGDIEAFERFRSNLLSIISHELNTPLGSILNALSVLEEKFPKEREYIPMLRRNAERLRKTVENLLDISRADAGVMRVRLSELDMENFLHQRKELLIPKVRQEDFEFSLEIEEDLPHVCADWRRLGYVFDSLVLNAIKFSDNLVKKESGKGAQVFVKLSLEPISSIPVGVLSSREKRTGMYIITSVYSSLPSVGESPEHFEQLFEPFSPWRDADTRVKEGLGVELAIAKEILLAHDGCIWADIPEDKSQGWVFSFALPLLSRMDELDLVVNNRLHTSIGALSKLSLLLVRASPGSMFNLEQRNLITRSIQKILFRASDSVFWLEDTAELAVLMDDCDALGAERVGKRLLESLHEEIPGLPFVWSVATGPDDGANARELLEKARSRWRPDRG